PTNIQNQFYRSDSELQLMSIGAGSECRSASKSIARQKNRERSELRADERSDAKALSDEMLAALVTVVGLGHEQPVPIFQQLTGGHPPGCDDVREIPAVATQRRGSPGRARDRHQP